MVLSWILSHIWPFSWPAKPAEHPSPTQIPCNLLLAIKKPSPGTGLRSYMHPTPLADPYCLPWSHPRPFLSCRAWSTADAVPAGPLALSDASSEASTSFFTSISTRKVPYLCNLWHGEEKKQKTNTTVIWFTEPVKGYTIKAFKWISNLSFLKLCQTNFSSPQCLGIKAYAVFELGVNPTEIILIRCQDRKLNKLA